jgi:DNA repair protein RecN (Recombination protein N)
MLTHLSIQGLAIIDQLTIDFTSGFNVITGETGAGKSILIKALSLLLGGKASQDCVRRGYEQASVTGRFLIRSEHAAATYLRSIGAKISTKNDHLEIEIRRCVSAKGRSTAWVQDIPVTTGSLKEMAASLIDVFGQHDSHRLLDTQQHVLCLDQFVEPKALVSSLQEHYAQASETMATLRQFVHEATGKGRDVDYLAFRLSEFEEFKPSLSDYDGIKELTERARSAATLSSALSKAQNLMETEDGDAISRRLREVSRILNQAKSIELEELANAALNISSSIDELSYGLGREAARIDVSEEDVDRAEARLAGYQALFRKHDAHNAEDLCAAWQKLKDQVNALENAAEHVHSLLGLLESQVNTAVLVSRDLASARRKAAGLVTQRVEKELADLAMPSAKFSVEFSDVSRPVAALDLAGFGEEAVAAWSDILDEWASISEIGSERAEFYLAANKGEASLPLAKVASGGEVSRIMLALKKALVVGAETCVLVFDEIDTGISGRVADVVGQKIAELSGYCQILCISHLPQVAAYADRHYVVQKIEGKDRTESTIMTLSDSDHLKEVARLLSGDKLTEASLQHAKNLVAEAKNRRSKKPLNRRQPQITKTSTQ